MTAGRAGWGRAGQGRAGQGRAGQGRAGQGSARRTGQSRQGRAGQGNSIRQSVYLIQSWLTVIDGLAVLSIEQEPAQHQGVVLCCHIPDGEEVAQALGHLLAVNCTVTRLVDEVLADLQHHTAHWSMSSQKRFLVLQCERWSASVQLVVHERGS